MELNDIFWWGCLGSIAVEIVSAYHAINENNGDLPLRYKKMPFLIIRGILAVVAGGLAIAYKINQPLLALNIGAATPLILQALAQGTRPSLPALQIQPVVLPNDNDPILNGQQIK